MGIPGAGFQPGHPGHRSRRVKALVDGAAIKLRGAMYTASDARAEPHKTTTAIARAAERAAEGKIVKHRPRHHFVQILDPDRAVGKSALEVGWARWGANDTEEIAVVAQAVTDHGLVYPMIERAPILIISVESAAIGTDPQRP